MPSPYFIAIPPVGGEIEWVNGRNATHVNERHGAIFGETTGYSKDFLIPAICGTTRILKKNQHYGSSELRWQAMCLAVAGSPESNRLLSSYFRNSAADDQPGELVLAPENDELVASLTKMQKEMNVYGFRGDPLFVTEILQDEELKKFWTRSQKNHNVIQHVVKNKPAQTFVLDASISFRDTRLSPADSVRWIIGMARMYARALNTSIAKITLSNWHDVCVYFCA